MRLIKKIIPAAIVLACAGTAHAETTLYGVIDMSYGKNEVVDGTSAKSDFHSGGDDGQSQGNSTTRIGVKGSYDVETDVKANFKFETNGVTSDGAINGTNDADSPTFFNRQAWFGLEHTKYGEVRLGRQDSVPYQVMGQFDFNAQSNGVTTAYSGAAIWATDRQSRSLQYIVPEFSGFNLHFGFVPEGDNSTTNSSDDNTDAIISAAFTFGKDELLVGASFESARESAANPNAEDFMSLAVSYDFKDFKVMAGYTDGPGLFTGSTESEGITLGIVAPVAGFNVGAHYADAENTVGGGKADSEALEIFANTKIFKNTYAYAEMLSLDREGASDPTNYAIGIIFVF